ncbi:MAG: 3-methyl-2-oxobutanoate hydroxymethyltransferase [Phycisphaerales bacterium]|nr:3-methyl-2-oxobutanoate hydroxymethyltransferase [Phycisphaerales bacterium]|tara:strand:- start:3705 stop:4610 length:906 start_codon:yes stop_codon:yes gene_type:complete
MNEHPFESKPVPPTGHGTTLQTLRRFVRDGDTFACLTCYDATTARWLQRAGVPLLLVGDTAAEMILGEPGTIHAPLEFMLLLTAAVKRGAPNTFIMGDMPFGSYQCDDAEAIRNAGRFLTEGRADAVKLEVDDRFIPLVEKLARAGVPVVAHLGSRPQAAKQEGGYRAAGRTQDALQRIVRDAIAMEKAGAVMLLLEAVPNEVAQAVVDSTSIPVIGCGAGTACHGQIVVTQDILGLTDWQPAFARPICELGDTLMDAAREWMRRVSSDELGEHPYRMKGVDSEKSTPAKQDPDVRESAPS